MEWSANYFHLDQAKPTFYLLESAGAGGCVLAVTEWSGVQIISI